MKKTALPLLALMLFTSPLLAQETAWDGTYGSIATSMTGDYYIAMPVALSTIVPIMAVFWLWRSGKRATGLKNGGKT